LRESRRAGLVLVFGGQLASQSGWKARESPTVQCCLHVRVEILRANCDQNLATTKAPLAAGTALAACLPFCTSKARLPRAIKARLSMSNVGGRASEMAQTISNSTGGAHTAAKRRWGRRAFWQKTHKVSRSSEMEREATEPWAAQKPFRGGLCIGSEVIRWSLWRRGACARESWSRCLQGAQLRPPSEQKPSTAP
jgi:hypothetical protein